MYINKLHVAIKYPEVYHFANNTDLLIFNSFVKSINKQVNYDLKKLIKLANKKTNKVSLNVGKTELVHFTSSKKQLYGSMKQIQSNIWVFKLTKD